MQFFKMQNLGNDYIFVENRPSREQVISICNRNFGVGADGVVYFYNENGVYGFEIFNSDGSKATFCGSVALCLGLYVYKKTGQKSFKIYTDSGEKQVYILKGGKFAKVAVEVGKPHFQCKNSNRERVFNKLLFLKSEGKILRVRASLVFVGNTHLVIKGLYNESKRRQIVLAIEKDNLFVNGVNVEFVERRKGGARIIVYERGSGKTLCCSSGGGAVLGLLNKMGYLSNQAQLYFDGGKMTAKMHGKKVFIYSCPRFVFSGEWGEE